MKAYLKFLSDNYKVLLFGGLLTMFSSFGQTFLISLYVPSILDSFMLSKAGFGLIYALATVAASLALIGLGPKIDYLPIWSLLSFTLILTAAASVVLGFAIHPLMLAIGLFGLRLAGQALMPHISMTVISRHFDKDRGKALSIASLGFPIGEMIFPLLIGLLISSTEWQRSLIISGTTVTVLLFLVFSQLELTKYGVSPRQKGRRSNSSLIFIKKIAIEDKFWIVTLPTFTMSFIVTGFFFFQYTFGEARGWSITSIAASFTGYAISRLIFSMLGGSLTDKFTAARLFPYYLIPMGIGLLIFSFWQNLFASPAFFVLIGITSGAQSIINTAVLAEVYGTATLGSVRSLFSTVMVISTASSPWLFGVLLDHDVSFNVIALLCFVFVVVCSLNSLRIKKYILQTNGYDKRGKS